MSTTRTLRSALCLTLAFAVLAQGRASAAAYGDSPWAALSETTTTLDTDCDGSGPSDTTSAVSPQALDPGFLVQDQDRLLGTSRVIAQLAWDRRDGHRSQASSSKAHKRADSSDARPTPEPTGDPSPSTTVHITDERDFALLMPGRQDEPIGDAENDGVVYCTSGSADSSCTHRLPEGFVRAAAVSRGQNGAYIQVTGCLNVRGSTLDGGDSGGQFDVRFPNGAQCTFGGYGKSFIQLIEPAAERFCLRCCSQADDQVNCNSHRDREGCQNAIPGTYSFPEVGVECED